MFLEGRAEAEVTPQLNGTEWSRDEEVKKQNLRKAATRVIAVLRTGS